LRVSARTSMKLTSWVGNVRQSQPGGAFRY